MRELPQRMYQQLAAREADNAFRGLPLLDGLVDFCSNDYLGLARSGALHRQIGELLTAEGIQRNGSTGSRLISGNSSLALGAEAAAARFGKSESALIFNSGYDANLGLLSCIASRHDTILYDELVHASVRDGIRLSLASAYAFRHNDMDDLRQKLSRAKGEIFICTESVFSMDGDGAPVEELAGAARTYGAKLIMDEAHAAGVYGDAGCGLAADAGYADVMVARVITFGKAMGVHGAAVLGSLPLRNYLVNFARSFIYSTALPPHSYAAITAALRMVAGMQEERGKLHEYIRYFTGELASKNIVALPSGTAIQSVIIPGNDAVKKKAQQIREAGLAVLPILSPTVPEGKERLRICLHSFNTKEEMDHLLQILAA